MTCEETLLLISSRLDGEISAVDHARLTEHLDACHACAATAEAFELQDAELRRTFEERRQQAGVVAESVISQLPEAPVTPRTPDTRTRQAPRLVVGFAAVAAALILVIWVTRHGSISPYHYRPPPSMRGPSAGSPRARPLAVAPAPLAPGDTVRTAVGERRRLALPDGSTVYVNQGSVLTLDRDRHLSLERGEVFVEVTPVTSGVGPFVVRTPQREITALGTKFAVRAGAARTALVVTQGSVRASGHDGAIAAGWQLDDRLTPAPRADHVLEWTRDLMAEAETPLVPGSRHAGGALIAVDSSGQEARLSLRKFHVNVHIEDGFARTTIDQTYFNHANWRLEGTFHFPLPPDASLSRLAMYVDGKLMEGGMVERDFGRQVYERIVTSQRDPALLEWVDGSTFKMRVFPLEARQEKRIVLSYSQRLPADYGRLRYRFPAGHSLNVVRDWSFQARLKDGARLAALSPSHPELRTRVEGADLLIGARAHDVAVGRDVVLELGDPDATPSTESTRLSSFASDGAHYFMLRYRPELPTPEVRRQRRDWVFLFESSGDRDPLLARAQIEIVRNLLGNIEHDDTFAILTAGTNVRSFHPYPLPATLENITSGLEFLERTHLIGALDLGKALAAAGAMAGKMSNPHLVHLGSGIAAMGERREDALAKRLPTGTRYVGVGVGKRWARGFMKAAAERSGGYVTQINPDEAISWRGFELYAALSMPRLLDIAVQDDAGRPFLTFATSAAHGEEIAAVARYERDVAPPRSLTVTGSLDSQTFRRELPVQDGIDGAGYLPRTWAKLEIDRLLAEDSRVHKDRIIALSKSTYVMTPFTSLLVLENEQMYRDFKVDRGRKDHWALYPCPEKIPVVYEPDPNSPIDPRAPANVKPTRQHVMQTILVRVPPRCLTSPGAPAGPDGVVVTALQAAGGRAVPNRSVRLNLGDFDGDFSSEVGFRTLDLGVLTDLRVLADTKEALPTIGSFFLAPPHNRPESLRAGESLEFDVLSERLGRSDWFSYQNRDGAAPVAFSADGTRLAMGGFNGRVRLWDQVAGTEVAGRSSLDDGLNQFGVPRGSELLGESFHFLSVLDLAPLSNQPVREMMLSENGQVAGKVIVRQLGATRAPQFYGRPSFRGDERLFSDLISSAPGMNTSAADIEAVLETETAPALGSLPGRLDPAARGLVARARSSGWQTLTLRGRSGKSELSVAFDGTGRYAFQRTLSSGLQERVVCDGTVLLHLYPELGVGARRVVSRFHRAEMARLIPWALPPVEDLALGHDVETVALGSVAISPRGAAAARTAEGKAVTYLRHLLVFAEDGRLAERRIVLMPEEKVLGRETYGADGTVTVFGRTGQEVARQTLLLSPAVAPELKPETAAVVVLPLPYRTREHVYASLGFDPNRSLDDGANRCHAFLDDSAALALFTANIAAQNPGEARVVQRNCFQSRDDCRPGYFTLLASAGGSFGTARDFVRLVTEKPHDPLLRYLALLQYPYYRTLPMRFGVNLGASVLADQRFFGLLASFRDRWLVWSTLDAQKTPTALLRWEQQHGLTFVRKHADSPLAWALLGQMRDRSPSGDRAFAQDLAAAWDLFSDHPTLGYAARYEQARSRLQAGQEVEARALFRGLFAKALEQKILPALDSSFREALRGNGKEADGWSTLMRETAAAFVAEKRRPVVVALAWQCWQLGDSPLASNLLDAALAGAVGEERVPVVLSAVTYANQTGQYALADTLLAPLLDDETLARHAVLWRTAASIAESRGQTARAIDCLERALAREFEDLPEVISLEAVRRDYGRLLDHYQSLARAISTLGVPPPRDLIARTIRAADRWRVLDRESETPCQSAAATLRLLGAPDLAWEYLTTPLGQKPNDSGPWLSLGQVLQREGQFALADRAYVAACEAEPTNAQILWDRAQNLRQGGQLAEAHDLLRQLADGDWQPRFEWIRSQARWQVEGR